MPSVAESDRVPATRGRDAGIDSLRGILILLVVIGHFPSTSKIPHVDTLIKAIGALVLSVVVSIVIAIAVSLVFSRALPRLSRYLGMTPQGDGGPIRRWIS